MFKALLSKRVVFRFIQVGILSATANFLFFAAVRLVLHDRKSDLFVLSVSTTFAIAFAFYMQSTYVWETGYRDVRAGARFATLNLFAFVVNVAIFTVLTSLDFPAISAQGVSLMCIAAISYFVQKKWVFLR